jgi:hypothetical protein
MTYSAEYIFAFIAAREEKSVSRPHLLENAETADRASPEAEERTVTSFEMTCYASWFRGKRLEIGQFAGHVEGFGDSAARDLSMV